MFGVVVAGIIGYRSTASRERLSDAEKFGTAIETRISMILITIINSSSVNPRLPCARQLSNLNFITSPCT